MTRYTYAYGYKSQPAIQDADDRDEACRANLRTLRAGHVTCLRA